MPGFGNQVYQRNIYTEANWIEAGTEPRRAIQPIIPLPEDFSAIRLSHA